VQCSCSRCDHPLPLLSDELIRLSFSFCGAALIKLGCHLMLPKRSFLSSPRLPGLTMMLLCYLLPQGPLRIIQGSSGVLLPGTGNKRPAATPKRPASPRATTTQQQLQHQQPQPLHPSTIHLTEQPIVQHYPTSPHMRSPPTPTSPPGYYLDSSRDVYARLPADSTRHQQQQPQQPSDLDAHYWRNMFKALGYEPSMDVMHSSDGYIYPTIPEPNPYAPTIGSAFGR
jgi:hypothetical protein